MKITLNFYTFLIIVFIIVIFHLILKYFIDKTSIDKYFINVYKNDILLSKSPRLIFIFSKKKIYLQIKKEIKSKVFIKKLNEKNEKNENKEKQYVNENLIFTKYSNDLKIKFNNKIKKITFIINNNYINLKSIYFFINTLFNLQSSPLKINKCKFNLDLFRKVIQFKKDINNINGINSINGINGINNNYSFNKKVKYYSLKEVIYFDKNKAIPANIIVLYNTLIKCFDYINETDFIKVLIYDGFESNYYSINNYGGLLIILNKKDSLEIFYDKYKKVEYMFYISNFLIQTKIESLFFNYNNIESKIDVLITNHNFVNNVNNVNNNIKHKLNINEDIQMYSSFKNNLEIPIQINSISIENEKTIKFFNTYCISINNFKKNTKMKILKF